MKMTIGFLHLTDLSNSTVKFLIYFNIIATLLYVSAESLFVFCILFIRRAVVVILKGTVSKSTMPTITIKRRLFKDYFGDIKDEELDQLLFRFGLELDEVTTEVFSDGSGKNVEEVVLKIEIPANRCDLLCWEGLIRALLIFYKSCEQPKYMIASSKMKPTIQLKVTKEVETIRPYVVAAVLRNVTFNRDAYDSFIALQEKLHQNICRKRQLVAIGTHDLDKVKGPFVYSAKSPQEICFKPLNEKEKFTAAQLMTHYSKDNHLRQYLHIIEHSPLFPYICDSEGAVLSMPPIINSDQSKITLQTKNILIECTAVDLHRAQIVLDTIVCMFSVYCDQPYQIDPVEVITPGGIRQTYPILSCRTGSVSTSKVNRTIGVKLPSVTVAQLLNRMGISAEVGSEDMVLYRIPPTRHDILHECDIIEDVAIAYGYNNIKKELPPAAAISDQLYLNKITEAMRKEIACAGFTEILTFSLCSRADVSMKLNQPEELNRAIARTLLLPGILKTLAHNKDKALPLKLFEIQDVVERNDNSGKDPVNRRHFCAVYYGKTSGFETIHGLLDHFMRLLEVSSNPALGYCIKEDLLPFYFPGRCASIMLRGEKKIGHMGILHPSVCRAFDLNLVCSCLELCFEDPLSRVGSFVASTGLLPRSSLSDRPAGSSPRPYCPSGCYRPCRPVSLVHALSVTFSHSEGRARVQYLLANNNNDHHLTLYVNLIMTNILQRKTRYNGGIFVSKVQFYFT
ncbi:Phenylalanine--tRNA ligase beta subunit [Trichinella zimbabwensis]|uniref:Phenylalanine--tRNA ligase beta subunit n=1 Tax=Trichinella zimbabwensis TaxID=268475 RepID=A0A0V1HP98_9BILA|nr:Phenylalanine--tRNA ligase beta subunit [Trichinella zimbabwensis]